MTPVFCCGFECGVDVPHWILSGTISFNTGTKKSGARSLRSNPTAASGSATSTTLTSANIATVRFYIYFASLPSANTELFNLGMAGAPGVYYKSSDTKIYAGYNAIPITFGSTGVTVTTGQWYRVDVLVNTSANPWTIDVQVDGSAVAQLTRSTGPANFTTYSIGAASTTTTDMYYDDFIASNTSGDYPIGPGYVNHFIPTSDGTHNIAGTNDFERTLTGTDILNSTTDAYLLVDDVPLESGAGVDWINMVAPPNATDYVKCKFGAAPGINTPNVAPRAVEVIAAIHQASTATGNMEIRIDDNGTKDAMYSATGVAGVTSIAYKRKHYATAPTGGAWTVVSGAGNFNNLQVEFGSPAALDAAPDQYFDSIMIEAEFVSPIPNKIVNINQAIKRSNTY